jgi:hypothetical protein
MTPFLSTQLFRRALVQLRRELNGNVIDRDCEIILPRSVKSKAGLSDWYTSRKPVVTECSREPAANGEGTSGRSTALLFAGALEKEIESETVFYGDGIPRCDPGFCTGG